MNKKTHKKSMIKACLKLLRATSTPNNKNMVKRDAIKNPTILSTKVITDAMS